MFVRGLLYNLVTLPYNVGYNTSICVFGVTICGLPRGTLLVALGLFLYRVSGYHYQTMNFPATTSTANALPTIYFCCGVPGLATY